jgi:hypothetical protein
VRDHMRNANEIPFGHVDLRLYRLPPNCHCCITRVTFPRLTVPLTPHTTHRVLRYFADFTACIASALGGRFHCLHCILLGGWYRCKFSLTQIKTTPPQVRLLPHSVTKITYVTWRTDQPRSTDCAVRVKPSSIATTLLDDKFQQSFYSTYRVSPVPRIMGAPAMFKCFFNRILLQINNCTASSCVSRPAATIYV